MKFTCSDFVKDFLKTFQVNLVLNFGGNNPKSVHKIFALFFSCSKDDSKQILKQEPFIGFYISCNLKPFLENLRSINEMYQKNLFMNLRSSYTNSLLGGSECSKSP